MTISYTALQAAIAAAASNTTSKVGEKLIKGTNSTPASFPGGFYAFSDATVSKVITLTDGASLTHDYRQGSIVRCSSYANISSITLTNVPYVGPSATDDALVPFTLLYEPTGATTIPAISTINGVAVSNRVESTNVDDGDKVIASYMIFMPSTGTPIVYQKRELYL